MRNAYLQLWKVAAFLLFNILVGMPGLFLFVASLYMRRIGLLGLLGEMLLWLIGNYMFVKKMQVIEILGVYVAALVILMVSALMFSRLLFGFR